MGLWGRAPIACDLWVPLASAAETRAEPAARQGEQAEGKHRQPAAAAAPPSGHATWLHVGRDATAAPCTATAPRARLPGRCQGPIASSTRCRTARTLPSPVVLSTRGAGGGGAGWAPGRDRRGEI